MASTLKKSLTMFRAPANSAAFRFRNLVRWERGVPELVSEPKAELFDYLELEESVTCELRHKELLDRYELQPLRDRSTRVDYRDNLALLEGLERLFDGAFSREENPLGTRTPHAVDVGAKNWSYVYALERFLRYWQRADGRDVALTGVEIDGYGIYRDFRSRADHARGHVERTGNARVQFEVGDFLKWESSQPLDVVTMFYPFLTRYALVQCGLPLCHYQPRRLIARALELLAENGVLVVFNQTREECDLLHGLIDEFGAEIVRCEPMATNLVHYRERTGDRWGTLARRSAD